MVSSPKLRPKILVDVLHLHVGGNYTTRNGDSQWSFDVKLSRAELIDGLECPVVYVLKMPPPSHEQDIGKSVRLFVTGKWKHTNTPRGGRWNDKKGDQQSGY
eukprot:SAG11_NODE_352_length_10364_cov_17.751388_3_plen_102_part_00